MYACIFIPDFIVEAVLRAEPLLRGQAVAVLEGKPPLCYVVGANEVARHLGVEIGMTKLLAETLKATEEQKIGGTEEQPRNRRSEEPKNEEPKNEKQNKGSFDFGRASPGASFAQDDTGSSTERVVRQRAHSAGAYEATYGRMDTRFGLYRTRLEAEELQANDPNNDEKPRADNSQGRPMGKRGEKVQRNGTPWSHEAIRQASFAPAGKSRVTQVLPPRSLVLRQRAAAQEESAHAALLDAAHAISPKVEDSGPDTVIVDIDGLERLFGTPQQVAQELMRRVTEVGLVGNVAVAANPDAAEHAARGFVGMTVLPANRHSERLSTLPLEILFAAEKSAVMRSTRRPDEQRKTVDRFQRMQETLDRWGIRNFRGLATLPPVSLSERLGTCGVQLQRLASGTAVRELALAEPTLRFEETIELEHPVDVLEPLAFLIARMLDGLCGRLAARALSTNELRLRMKLEHRTGDEATKSEEELDGEPIVERKLTLPVPMNDARLFLKLLQLELSATPPGAPVTQMWLEAEPARPRIGQSGLFQPLAPETQKLELTLARMHKLLAVREQLRAGAAEITDTHQPDAFKVERFKPVDPEDKRKRTEGAHHTSYGEQRTENIFGALSLRRFRPPYSVVVDLREGVPVRVSCAKLGVLDPLHDNIVWAAGPWRTCGNWWEAKRENEAADGTKKSAAPSNAMLRVSAEDVAESWKNEEWDIALAITLPGSSAREHTTQIGLYRLVQNRVTAQWVMEGGYD